MEISLASRLLSYQLVFIRLRILEVVKLKELFVNRLLAGNYYCMLHFCCLIAFIILL